MVDGTGEQVALTPLRFGGKVTTPTVAEGLEAMAQTVVDLIDWIQGATAKTRKLTMSKDDSGPSPPGGGGGGGGGFTNSYDYCFDTNQLWLNITNVSGGTAFVNLHNGTNYVYEIFTKTNLLQANWDICRGSVSNRHQLQSLHGVRTTGRRSSVPVSLSGAGLDGRHVAGQPDAGMVVLEILWDGKFVRDNGLTITSFNTLHYDYTNHQAPGNVIQLTVAVTNNYMATANASAQIVLQGGVPGYIAIAVDNTNYLNTTNWTAYTTSDITVPLGSAQGWHDVWIGLRGYRDDTSAAVSAMEAVEAGHHAAGLGHHRSDQRDGERAHDSIDGLQPGGAVKHHLLRSYQRARPGHQSAGIGYRPIPPHQLLGIHNQSVPGL